MTSSSSGGGGGGVISSSSSSSVDESSSVPISDGTNSKYSDSSSLRSKKRRRKSGHENDPKNTNDNNQRTKSVYETVRRPINNPYVGRLEKLWIVSSDNDDKHNDDDSSTTKNNSIMCRIRWFLKKRDLEECIRGRFYGVQSKDVVLQSMDEDHDLVLLRTVCDENPVNVILGKADVVYRPPIAGVLSGYDGAQEQVLLKRASCSMLSSVIGKKEQLSDEHDDEHEHDGHQSAAFVCRYEMRMSQKATAFSTKKKISIHAYNDGTRRNGNNARAIPMIVSDNNSPMTATSVNVKDGDCHGSRTKTARRRSDANDGMSVFDDDLSSFLSKSTDDSSIMKEVDQHSLAVTAATSNRCALLSSSNDSSVNASMMNGDANTCSEGEQSSSTITSNSSQAVSMERSADWLSRVGNASTIMKTRDDNAMRDRCDVIIAETSDFRSKVDVLPKKEEIDCLDEPSAGTDKEVLKCSFYLCESKQRSRTERKYRKHQRISMRRMLLQKFLQYNSKQLHSRLGRDARCAKDAGMNDFVIKDHPRRTIPPMKILRSSLQEEKYRDAATKDMVKAVRKKRLVSSKSCKRKKVYANRRRRDRPPDNALSFLEMSTPSPSSKSSSVIRQMGSTTRKEKSIKSLRCKNAGDTLTFLNQLPKSPPLNKNKHVFEDSDDTQSAPPKGGFDSLMSLGKPTFNRPVQSPLVKDVTRKCAKSPRNQSEIHRPILSSEHNINAFKKQDKFTKKRKLLPSKKKSHNSISIQNVLKQSRLGGKEAVTYSKGEQSAEVVQVPLQRKKTGRRVAYDSLATEKKIINEEIEKLILKRDTIQKKMDELNDEKINEEARDDSVDPDNVTSETCADFNYRTTLHDKVSTPSFFVRRPQFCVKAPIAKNILLEDLKSANDYAKAQKDAAKAEAHFCKMRKIRAIHVRRFFLHKWDDGEDFSALFRSLTGEDHNFPPSFLAYILKNGRDDDESGSEEDEDSSEEEENDDQSGVNHCQYPRSRYAHSLQLQPGNRERSDCLKLLPDRNVAASIMARLNALDNVEKCGKCPGCLVDDCGECSSCLEMPRFGGKSATKKDCLHRRCIESLSSALKGRAIMPTDHADSSDIQSLSDHEAEDMFEADDMDEVQPSNLSSAAGAPAKPGTPPKIVVPRTAAEIARAFRLQERSRSAAYYDDDDSSDESEEDNYMLDFL